MAMTVSEARKKYGSASTSGSNSAKSNLSVQEVLENRRKRLKQEAAVANAEQNRQGYEERLSAAIQQRKDSQVSSLADYQNLEKAASTGDFRNLGITAEDFLRTAQLGAEKETADPKNNKPNGRLFGFEIGNYQDPVNPVEYARKYADYQKEVLRNSMKYDGYDLYKANNAGVSGLDVEGVDMPLTYMTDSQRNVYNYYVGSGEQETADKYLASIYEDLEAQWNSRQQWQGREIADESPAFANVMSVATGAARPIGAASDVINYATGKELNTDDQYHMGNTMTEALRDEVSKDYNNVEKFLYDAAMSGADSLLMGQMGGVGATLLGAGAASDAIVDAKNRGASDGQAIAQGIAQGVAEGLFEKLSIGNMKSMKEIPVSTVRDVLMNTAKSIGVNASEEAFTEIANSITDSLIMGENSNFNTSVALYKASGMTEKEAFKKAMGDNVVQVLLSGLGGALMGGVFSAIGQGSNYMQTSAIGKQISDKEVNAAISEGLNMPDTDSYRLAAALMERQTAGADISDYQAGNLVRTIELDKAPARDAAQRAAKKQNRSERLASLKEGRKSTNTAPEISRQIADETDVDESVTTRAMTDAEMSEAEDNYILDSDKGYNVRGYAELTEQWKNYKGKVGPVEYEEAFKAAYDAGWTGQAVPQTAQTALLSKDTLQIAYNSGAADSQASRASLQSVQSLAKAMEGGGIIKTQSAQRMMETDREQYDAVDALGKAIGIKVNIVNTLGDANGVIHDGMITIARDAIPPASTVLKHELTHAMQDISPEMYQEYKDFVTKSILEYDEAALKEAVADYISRYAEDNIKLTEEEALDELVADASERFLNDAESIEQFAETLREEDRGLVEKIVDFFKDLVEKLKKAITDVDPHSKAAQLLNENLEVAQKAEKLWQQGLAKIKEAQASDTQNAPERTSKNEAASSMQTLSQDGEKDKNSLKDKNHKKYSLKGYSEHTKENWKSSKRIVVYENEAQLSEFIDKALADTSYDKKMYFGAVSSELATDIKENTGLEVEDYNFTLQTSEIRKIFKDHGSEKTEESRGQRAITKEDILHITDVLESPDSIEYAGTFEGHEAIRFKKEINGRTTVVAYAKNKHMDLTVQTMYAGQQKRNLAAPVDEQASPIRPKRGSGTVSSTSSISQTDKKDNTKYSLKDTKGRTLSEKQAEYFKDSKVRDDAGNLKVMYHGTPNASHTTFRSGTYFTENKKYADVYQDPGASMLRVKNDASNPGTYEVYLNITEPFDTRKPEIRKVFEEEYYRKWGTGSPLAESGLPDWTDGIDLQEFIEEMGYDYDGLILDEGGYYDADGNVVKRGLSYVVFDSNQVKGVTNTTPTRNADIRYSLKDTSKVDVKKLQKENEHLKELNENLRAQFRLTKEFAPSRKELTAAAKKILTDYNSSYELETLVDNMDSIYKFIANNQIDSEQSDEVADAFASIAKKVLEKSGYLDTSLYDAYSDLRAYLRNTNIRVTSEMKKEIDGYNDIRRSYLGRVKMTNDGTEIDTIHDELAGMYPNLFDSTISDPVDQLFEIMDVSDSLKPTYRPLDGADLNEAAALLAHELFDSYFDIALNKPTVADKHKKAISRIKAEKRNKIGQIKAKLRADHARALKETKQRYQSRIDQKEAKLLAQKQRYREMQENARNRKSVSALRHRISRNANKLREKLMANTETKHIPAELRGAVLQLLMELDFSTGRPGKDGGMSTFDEKLAALHSAYESLLKREYEHGFTLDEDLAIKLDELKKVTVGKVVRQLTQSELETVDEIVTEILHAVNTANKLFKDGRKADLDAVGAKALGELEQRKKWRRLRVVDENKFLRSVSDFINSGNVTPTQMFDRIGGVIQEYFQEVRNGEGNYIRLISKAQDYAHEAMQKYNFKEWGVGKKAKEQKTFKLSSGNVSLTVGELMYIYAASQREQARAHMVGEKAGGITPTSQNNKGVWTSPKDSAVKLTENDLGILFNGLTEEQKNFANEMRDYLAKDCAEQGNEVTMAMYGIRKFGEEKYIPIVTDPNFLFSKVGVSEDARIKHSGFTKATVPNASNPISAVDFMDVWAQHVGDMALYNSFVRQLDDFQRVWNYKARGDKDNSVKAMIEQALGVRANSYITQLIRDINGGIKADPNESLSAQLVSATKKVSVAGNLRVVIQQPSAIGRAFAEINPKYFLNKGKISYAELEKYVPQASLKKMGYFDTDMGASITQSLIQQDLTDNRIEKIKDFFKNEYGTRDDAFNFLAEKADEVTWGIIWNAVKEESKQTTNLQVGSHAYWEHCAERMVEVIDKTQVMDSVFQRSQAMRSKNGLVKMATAFMSEPTKTYGMIWRAVTKIYDGEKDAWKNMLSTMTAIVFQTALNTALASLIDAMRNDEDEEYWKKWSEAFLDGMVDAPLSLIPYVRDVSSLFQGYSVKRTDMSVIEDIVKAAKAWGNDKKTLWEKTVASLKALSDLTGIPIQNVYRDVNAATRMFMDMYKDVSGISDYEASLEGRWETYLGSNELAKGKDVTEYNDLLFESVEEGEAQFREIVQYGLSAGRTQSDMYSAINDRFYKKYQALIGLAMHNYLNGNGEAYNDIVAYLEGKGYSRKNTINKVMENVRKKIRAGEIVPETTTVDEVVDGYYTEDGVDSLEDCSDLFVAYAAGDGKAYNAIYNDLKAKGKTDAAIKTAITTRRRKAVESSQAYQDLIQCCVTGTGDYTEYYSKLVQNYPYKMTMSDKQADVAALVLRSDLWDRFVEDVAANDTDGMRKYGRYLVPLTKMSLSELRKKAAE